MILHVISRATTQIKSLFGAFEKIKFDTFPFILVYKNLTRQNSLISINDHIAIISTGSTMVASSCCVPIFTQCNGYV